MSRNKSAAILAAATWSFAAATWLPLASIASPSDGPFKTTWKNGWLTSGSLPKRRSFTERKARRAKRDQKRKGRR